MQARSLNNAVMTKGHDIQLKSILLQMSDDSISQIEYNPGDDATAMLFTQKPFAY